MTHSSVSAGYASLLLCLGLAACDERKTDPPKETAVVAPAEPSPAPAPSAVPPPAPSAWVRPAPKVDTVDAAALKAGLEKLLPRKQKEVEAAAKIAPNPNSRLFMHPGDEKTALVEFSVKGLSSLDLAPYIEDFGDAKACHEDARAGVVELRYSLDSGAPTKVTVDRTYVGTITINVGGASRLKLEVDRANDTSMCDWFSVGFLNVK